MSGNPKAAANRLAELWKQDNRKKKVAPVEAPSAPAHAVLDAQPKFDLDAQPKAGLDIQLNERLDVQNVSWADNQSELQLDAQLITNVDAQFPYELDSQTHPTNNAQPDAELDAQLIRKVDSQAELNLGIQLERAQDAQPKNLAVQPTSSPSEIDTKISKRKRVGHPTSTQKSKKEWKKEWEENRERDSDRGRVFIRPRTDILNRINHKRVDLNLTQQEWYEEASLHYLEHLDAQPKTGLDSNIATDDRRLMIRFNTTLSIISLYRELTGNKWDAVDDRLGKEFNDVDIRLVEISMLKTHLKSQRRGKKKINSFNYYCEELRAEIAMKGMYPSLDHVRETVRNYYEEWKRTGLVVDIA